MYLIIIILTCTQIISHEKAIVYVTHVHMNQVKLQFVAFIAICTICPPHSMILFRKLSLTTSTFLHISLYKCLFSDLLLSAGLYTNERSVWLGLYHSLAALCTQTDPLPIVFCDTGLILV